MERLDVGDFARGFGISENEMPPECAKLIGSMDFRYRVLNGKDRDEVILGIIKTLNTELPMSGPNRLAAWEEGWSENLRAFVQSGFKLEALLPFYNRRGKKVMRWKGEYILPTSLDFEANFLAVLKIWLVKMHFEGVEHVYEFGCGPAHHLAAFAQIYPEKLYHGLDWAPASQEIIKHLAASQEANITGHRFDMFSPDGTVHIEPNAAVITMDSMEQLGEHYRPFLDYLLAESPKRCIHIEPLYELYDVSGLPDYLAERYSMKRGYLRGFLPALRELERAGQIVIHDVRKILGSLYQDGWSLVTWTPVGRSEASTGSETGRAGPKS